MGDDDNRTLEVPMGVYDLIAQLGRRELGHRRRAARAPSRSWRRGYWLWLAGRRRRERLTLIYGQVAGHWRSPLQATLPVRDVTREGHE